MSKQCTQTLWCFDEPQRSLGTKMFAGAACFIAVVPADEDCKIAINNHNTMSFFCGAPLDADVFDGLTSALKVPLK